jgi:hypothetical protein
MSHPGGKKQAHQPGRRRERARSMQKPLDPAEPDETERKLTLWCPRCWLAHLPSQTRCDLCQEPVLPWNDACQKYKEIMAQVRDGINKKGRKKC